MYGNLVSRKKQLLDPSIINIDEAGSSESDILDLVTFSTNTLTSFTGIPKTGQTQQGRDYVFEVGEDSLVSFINGGASGSAYQIQINLFTKDASDVTTIAATQTIAGSFYGIAQFYTNEQKFYIIHTPNTDNRFSVAPTDVRVSLIELGSSSITVTEVLNLTTNIATSLDFFAGCALYLNSVQNKLYVLHASKQLAGDTKLSNMKVITINIASETSLSYSATSTQANYLKWSSGGTGADVFYSIDFNYTYLTESGELLWIYHYNESSTLSSYKKFFIRIRDIGSGVEYSKTEISLRPTGSSQFNNFEGRIISVYESATNYINVIYNTTTGAGAGTTYGDGACTAVQTIILSDSNFSTISYYTGGGELYYIDQAGRWSAQMGYNSITQTYQATTHKFYNKQKNLLLHGAPNSNNGTKLWGSNVPFIKQAHIVAANQNLKDSLSGSNVVIYMSAFYRDGKSLLVFKLASNSVTPYSIKVPYL